MRRRAIIVFSSYPTLLPAGLPGFRGALWSYLAVGGVLSIFSAVLRLFSAPRACLADEAI